MQGHHVQADSHWSPPCSSWMGAAGRVASALALTLLFERPHAAQALRGGGRASSLFPSAATAETSVRRCGPGTPASVALQLRPGRR
ncbi:hypothetical protein FM112_12490 [Gulosibacter sp. 10]|nr:hypothetical protein FM112_12490 [Gulosibacter sp. 10]